MDLKTFIQQYSRDLESVSESPALDLQVLVAHRLKKPRSWVLAHLEEPLPEGSFSVLYGDVSLLLQGVPLPYVLGEWEFYGNRFIVTPDVLIPRPETELLVEKALEWINSYPETKLVVDIGTGSGCIAISLALANPNIQVIATDISIKALKIAQQNIHFHHVEERVFLLQADLHPALYQKVDLICANLPYIPKQDLLSLKVAEKEPLIALDGGENGLILYRRLLTQLAERAESPHFLLCEIDPHQAIPLDTFIGQLFPFSHRQVYCDLYGFERLMTVEFNKDERRR
ncbi:MAG: peptide chain release factor N(5)-glutamine methyltransferase [Anaerolineales bacterium]